MKPSSRPVSRAKSAVIVAPLPANLPSITNAKIPATYEAAKAAISQCVHVDECKDWADKAEALASYARQAQDTDLRRMADRIQARAIRRCGQLMRELPENKGGRPSKAKPGPAPTQVSKSKAAKDAGLSIRQKKTALRVANVPTKEFEEAVESDNPPTVTQLAESGKRPAPPDGDHLGGRDPEDYKLSTQVQGQLRSFSDFLANSDAAAAVRGASKDELPRMVSKAKSIGDWLERLLQFIEV
jgi:hypothetical protein